jgi:hypothetical protein
MHADMVTNSPARFCGICALIANVGMNGMVLGASPAIAADEGGDPCLELAGIGATIMEMRQADIDGSAALDLSESSIVEIEEDRDLFGFLVTMG